MNSIRTRLIVGTTLAMAVLLTAGALLLNAFIRREVIRRFDASLMEKARLLASSVELEGDEFDVAFEELDMAEFQERTGPDYLELRRPDGRSIYRSPSLAGTSLNLRPSGEDPRPVDLPTGKAGRAVSLTFSPRREYVLYHETDAAPGRLTLVLARDATGLHGLLDRLAAYLAVGGILTIACAVGLLLGIIDHSTRPLRTLADRIATLSGADLSGRVEVPDAPGEIRPVVEKLNQLLGRIERAFRRERQFSSDVAHELRTPLSGIRSLAEVELSQAREADDYERALQEVLEITTRMQALVGTLLKLSRLECGRVEITSEDVRVEAILRRCWESLEPKARQRDLQVRWELEDAGAVRTDGDLLEVAVQNVLENAVIHADAGGDVRIATRRDGDRLEIRVANPAAGLSAEDIPHLFERFWQTDPARTETGVRCGLGLALTAQIMETLGGEAGAEMASEETFRVILALEPFVDLLQ